MQNPTSSSRSTPAERRARLAKRERWLRKIDPEFLFHRLFDAIPGAYFFAKNERGELMFLNRSNRERCHLREESAAIGLTDFDVNPPDLARVYVEDDDRIRATGQPLLNRVELWFDHLGIPNWFVVNKMPIRSRGGKIIGIMGFTQSYEGRAQLLEPQQGLAKALGHLRENYQRDVRITDLARIGGYSPRQLERKFKEAFGVGPLQFLTKTRLLASCRLLREGSQALSEIAYACGFSDQSGFARTFRRYLGMTPSRYRAQGGGGSGVGGRKRQVG